MNDRKDQPVSWKIFKIGTPECAIFSGVAAMALGLLLLTVGFWNTVWISLLAVCGGFVGGVRDKKQWLKNVLNHIIPEKKTMPYREQHPEITRAVRDAAQKSGDGSADVQD